MTRPAAGSQQPPTQRPTRAEKRKAVGAGRGARFAASQTHTESLKRHVSLPPAPAQSHLGTQTPRFLRRSCQPSQQPLHAQPTHSEEEERPAAPGCGGKVISIDYRSIVANHGSRSSSTESDFSQLSPLYLALRPWNLSSRSILVVDPRQGLKEGRS